MNFSKEEVGLPGFGPSTKFDLKKYAVRYVKVLIDDASQLAELEILETKGLAGEDIIILSKEKFNHFEKYYIVLNYLEKKAE
jgi:hypothetical protein